MNGNLNDTIGGANLFGGYNYSYAPDRFNTSNSAIYFNNGYVQVPDGYYFNGDFSFSIWIKLNSFNQYVRVFDFGCIIMTVFGNDNSDKQVLIIMSDGTRVAYLFASSVKIQLGLWYHVVYVLQGDNGSVYINGALSSSGQQMKTSYGLRTNNYIARSDTYIDTNAIYD